MLLPWIALNQWRGAVRNTKEALPLAAYSGMDKMENKDNAHHDGTNSQYHHEKLLVYCSVNLIILINLAYSFSRINFYWFLFLN